MGHTRGSSVTERVYIQDSDEPAASVVREYALAAFEIAQHRPLSRSKQ